MVLKKVEKEKVCIEEFDNQWENKEPKKKIEPNREQAEALEQFEKVKIKIFNIQDIMITNHNTIKELENKKSQENNIIKLKEEEEEICFSNDPLQYEKFTLYADVEKWHCRGRGWTWVPQQSTSHWTLAKNMNSMMTAITTVDFETAKTYNNRHLQSLVFNSLEAMGMFQGLGQVSKSMTNYLPALKIQLALLQVTYSLDWYTYTDLERLMLNEVGLTNTDHDHSNLWPYSVNSNIDAFSFLYVTFDEYCKILKSDENTRTGWGVGDIVNGAVTVVPILENGDIVPHIMAHSEYPMWNITYKGQKTDPNITLLHQKHTFVNAAALQFIKGNIARKILLVGQPGNYASVTTVKCGEAFINLLAIKYFDDPIPMPQVLDVLFPDASELLHAFKMYSKRMDSDDVKYYTMCLNAMTSIIPQSEFEAWHGDTHVHMGPINARFVGDVRNYPYAYDYTETAPLGYTDANIMVRNIYGIWINEFEKNPIMIPSETNFLYPFIFLDAVCIPKTAFKSIEMLYVIQQPRYIERLVFIHEIIQMIFSKMGCHVLNMKDLSITKRWEFFMEGFFTHYFKNVKIFENYIMMEASLFLRTFHPDDYMLPLSFSYSSKMFKPAVTELDSTVVRDGISSTAFHKDVLQNILMLTNYNTEIIYYTDKLYTQRLWLNYTSHPMWHFRKTLIGLNLNRAEMWVSRDSKIDRATNGAKINNLFTVGGNMVRLWGGGKYFRTTDEWSMTGMTHVVKEEDTELKTVFF